MLFRSRGVPCPPLHTITLLFDNALFFYLNVLGAVQPSLGQKYRILCNEIDGILANEGRDSENIITSLTLKSLDGSPGLTVNQATDAAKAAFPKLHLRGSLKIDFSIQSMSKISL